MAKGYQFRIVTCTAQNELRVTNLEDPQARLSTTVSYFPIVLLEANSLPSGRRFTELALDEWRLIATWKNETNGDSGLYLWDFSTEWELEKEGNRVLISSYDEEK